MATIRVTVKVSYRNAAGERCVLQRERKFSSRTPLRVRKAWKATVEAKLRKRLPASSDRTNVTGTLKADSARYLPLVRHLADWGSQRANVRAWFPHLGDQPRAAIGRADVLRVIGMWKAAGKAHRTINNYVSALRDMYRKLDGDDAENPCAHVPFLKPARTPIPRISAETINTVLYNLLVRGSTTIPPRGRQPNHALQDRARLMVLASTGRRPCEVERAQPDDVSLEQKVWGVRDAKGGWSEGLYLNAEMVIAWETFIATEAWGPFPAHFPRRLRDAGWPKGIRPYTVRHATWIAASERGADLADISAGAGHRQLATARKHYVPVLNSRMQKLSTLIDGRFGWTENGCTGSAGGPMKSGVH
jgi:integrase